MISKKKTINRSAGILCHPSSLPTPYGIGDFGSSAIHFIQYLVKCGQKYWQILPLNFTGYGDSPYQCISAFAGNPLLIAPDGLIEMNLISKKEVMQCLQGTSDSTNDHFQWTHSTKVDYNNVRKFKDEMLSISYSNFILELENPKCKHRDSFEQFCDSQKYWLDDFVVFFSLKIHHKLQAWIKWDKKYRHKKSNENAINVWIAGHQKELNYYKFIQWIFDFQWQQVKSYANNQGIQIIGDLPIFVAHDSADVWANPNLFTLNSDGTLEYQAGVPPDYFSPTGQLWGNPLYNWNILAKEKYYWLISRFKRQIEIFDWIRVDHFRGFEAYWRIKGKDTTAIDGEWIKAPGIEFFSELETQLGELPIIAEDLGIITPEVEELRDFFHFPGMKVFQFAFGSEANNPHLPHNVVPNCIVYSGTHDNDTTLGWWQNSSSKEEQKMFRQYLDVDGLNVNSNMIKAVYRSVANLAIIPIQDLFGQNSEFRMNKPSSTQGNWQYRISYELITDEKAKWLKNEAILYGRIEIDL